MTIHTIKTHTEESDRIYKGEQRFVIRSDKEWFMTGDMISFLNMRDQKPAFHDVNKKTYKVTVVLDHDSAPIEKGYRFIGFKEVA